MSAPASTEVQAAASVASAQSEEDRAYEELMRELGTV
jgi:hypothetical protein